LAILKTTFKGIPHTAVRIGWDAIVRNHVCKLHACG